MSTIKIKLKDTLTFTIGTDTTIDVSFTCNGVSYSSFYIYAPKASQKLIKYGETLVYDFPTLWLNTAYQIIEIDPTQTNFQTFITAMKSNIEGVELEAGTYKWVDSPNLVVNNGVFNFTSNSTDFKKIIIGSTSINYSSTASGPTVETSVLIDKNIWSNDAYKTITTTENQYIDYDFYNYAILGNQLVKQGGGGGTNKLKFGTETPSKLYLGTTEVTKAYMGDTLVYEKG